MNRQYRQRHMRKPEGKAGLSVSGILTRVKSLVGDLAALPRSFYQETKPPESRPMDRSSGRSHNEPEAKFRGGSPLRGFYAVPPASKRPEPRAFKLPVLKLSSWAMPEFRLPGVRLSARKRFRLPRWAYRLPPLKFSPPKWALRLLALKFSPPKWAFRLLALKFSLPKPASGSSAPSLQSPASRSSAPSLQPPKPAFRPSASSLQPPKPASRPSSSGLQPPKPASRPSASSLQPPKPAFRPSTPSPRPPRRVSGKIRGIFPRRERVPELALKKDRTKRLDFFLLTLALAFLGIRVFHAGSGKVIQAVTPPLTLVFTQWWQDELEENTLEKLAGEFEKIHPGIKIKLDTRPYDEIRNLLLTEAKKEGTPPWGDIVALDPLWLRDLIQRDVLEKLGDWDLPKGSGDSEANMFPVNFTVNSSEESPEKGEVWSLPLVSFISPLFYNIDLLKEAGFSRPPKTRSEFISMAAALTDASQGRFGAAFSLAGSRDLYQNIYPWIWASGAQLLPEGKPAITLRSVTETLDFFNQLHKQGSLTLLENGQGLEDFIQGKMALMVGSARDINTLVKRMGKGSFGITTVPVPDSYVGKPVFGICAWHGGISSSSPHKETARLFLSFLEKKSGFIAEKAHAIPGSGEVSGIETDPLYFKAWDMYAGGNIIQEFAMIPRLAELETAFREELYLVFEENRPAPVVAEAIQKRWERALGKN